MNEWTNNYLPVLCCADEFSQRWQCGRILRYVQLTGGGLGQ